MFGKSRVMSAALTTKAKLISFCAFIVAIVLASAFVKRFALYSALFAALTVTARANDIYIAQSASGSANGSSCTNAFPYSYFNAGGNWTSTVASGAQIGPGSTVHVCGTITVAAGTTALTFQGPGVSGNPVTLKFESNAILASPAFSGSGGIIDRFNYTVIDGGSNGVLENTANGSGMTYDVHSEGVVVGGTGITVQNLTVQNICQRTAGSSGECNAGGNDSGGIGCTGGCTNVTFTKNTANNDGGGACLFYAASSGDSNVTFSYNTVSGCNWGIAAYSLGGTSSGFYIEGNDISCTVGAACIWDEPTDGYHHNGIMLFPQSGDVMQNVVIANNYIHDIQSSTNSSICGGGAGCVTALVFIDPAGGNNLPGIQYYNNLLVSNPPAGTSGPSNAILQSSIDTGCSNCTPNAIIVNNTIIGNAAWGTGCDDACTVENNIIANGMQYNYTFDSIVSPNVVDYNDLYGASSGIKAGYGALSSWQLVAGSVCTGGCDAHSLSVNPQLNDDYTLQPGSAVIGKGVNLSSLGISGLSHGAPQYFGVNYACGNGCASRSDGGVWDMGAYPSSAVGAAGNPAAPTGLTGSLE